MRSILIVDDCSDIQQYLISTLEHIGYHKIHSVSSAEETYKILKEQTFDIIFLDIELPDANGKEILDHINYRYNNIAVIMCSGFNTVDNVKRTWELGAKGFLAKPFTKQKVLSLMKRISSIY